MNGFSFFSFNHRLNWYISNDCIEYYLKQGRSSRDRGDASSKWYKQIYDSAYPFTHGCNPDNLLICQKKKKNCM